MRQPPGYVYEIYDRTGRAIYVGAAGDVSARLEGHYKTSWWAEQIHRVRATVHPRVGLTDAERRRIRDLRPRWNLNHLPARREWTATQYVDWLISRERRIAWENATHVSGLRRKPEDDRQLQIVRREFARRFGYAAPAVLLPELADTG